MKSIPVLASTCLLAFFTISAFGQINNANTIERAASSESGTSVGGDGNGDSGNGGDDDGGSGDDDDDDYEDFQPGDSNKVKLRINDEKELLSLATIGITSVDEWFEPAPKHIRKAEIVSAPPGTYCVFWAPQDEGNGKNFIAPVIHLPETEREITFDSIISGIMRPQYDFEVDAQSNATLNKFELDPEVPAFPAHIVTNFRVRYPMKMVIVLLEVKYANSEETQMDILHVNLNQFMPNKKRFGSVNLDGKEGQYNFYGYPSEPTVVRARVLAAPYLKRTKCILSRYDSTSAKYFTSEGETPTGQYDSAEMLVCKEESDDEEKE